MTTGVNVLRMFTDPDGKSRNLFRVVSVGAALAKDRQRLTAELGYNEAGFIEGPASGSWSVCAEIFTHALELLFAGHPTAGAAVVHYTSALTIAEVFGQWTPELVLDELNSPKAVDAALKEYVDDLPHLWAWIDKSAGHIRSRAFALELEVRWPFAQNCRTVLAASAISLSGLDTASPFGGLGANQASASFLLALVGIATSCVIGA